MEECWPCRHNDGHSIQQKRLGVGVQTQIPPQQRQRQADPWALWPISLAYLMSCKPVRDLASQTEVDGDLRDTHTPTYMCTHIYTPHHRKSHFDSDKQQADKSQLFQHLPHEFRWLLLNVCLLAA